MMKTKLAALTVLLMAGAATAAFAQDQGDHRGRGDGGERPAMTPGRRPAEARPWQGPAFTPRAAPAAPQPRQAPAAPIPQAPTGGHWAGRGAGPGGGHWNGPPPSAPGGARWTPPAGAGGQGFRDHGAPRADHPRGSADGGGHTFVRRPGTWVDTEGENPNRNTSQADRNDDEDRAETRDWHRFNNGEFQGEGGTPQVQSWGRDHGGGRGDHHGRGDNGDRGDHRDWRDHGGGDHRGDHGGDRGDHGDHRGDHGDHPQWRPGAYPHSYHSHNRFHWRAYHYPVGFFAHTWMFGEFLPEAWYAPDYVIQDWWDFDLPEPPYGYDWVRVGSDALLVDEYDGRIVQVVRDLFW